MKRTKHMGVRISWPLYKVVQAYLERGACLNESDLLRTALSKYLKKEVPELYKEIMELR